MKSYDPFNWYWIVAGDESRVYSTTRADYVPADDAEFVAWKEDETLPTRIDTAFNLGGVLAAYQLTPIPLDVLEGYEATLASDPAVAVSYDHENRLRSLEGAPPLSLGAFMQSKMR